MNNAFFRKLFQPENKDKRIRIIAAFFLGILLLVSSKGFFSEEKLPEETAPPAVDEQRQEKDLEKDLEEILSCVAGAGKVRVMLTYRSGTEQILAMDERREESDKDTGGSVQTESTLVLAENPKGGESPVVLQEMAPLVEGVVIVAQGGEDAVVCGRLTEAAQALLDIPPHKIAVLKMEQGGEK